MVRRTFLIAGLAWLAVRRLVRGQPAAGAPQYAPLTTAVRIPLDAVGVPWWPVPFRAEAVAPGARRVLLSGVVFRRPAAAERTQLSALCVTCTHEQCQVDFVAEPAQLPRTDHVMTQPVFLCACHSSVFDAAGEGAWISGPAPRGLYRFRTRVDGDAVVITEVEEEALLAV